MSLPDPKRPQVAPEFDAKMSKEEDEAIYSDALMDSQASPKIDLMRLGEAVEALNDYVAPVLQNMHFGIAESDGCMVVMAMNVETQTVMRYIPLEEVIAIGRSLERLRSLALRKK